MPRRHLPGLEAPLQDDGLRVGGAADGEDGVGGAPSFHEGGHRLAQVQAAQVPGGRALWRGHAGVDLHLSVKGLGEGAGSVRRNNFIPLQCVLSQRKLTHFAHFLVLNIILVNATRGSLNARLCVILQFKCFSNF